MAKDCLLGLMVVFTKALTKRTKNMDMEFSSLLMEVDMKVNGQMENSMVKGNLSQRMEKLRKERGKTVSL